MVGLWGRAALTVLGLLLVGGLGAAAGPAALALVWGGGTVVWLLLMGMWPAGPIAVAARRRGAGATVLWAPLAVPFGMGLSVYAVCDFLGSLGLH
jgi:hypothetical protein